MAEAKELVRSAMLRAQIELEGALAELDRMSPFDGGSAAFAAHALNNYLTVAKGTVELLLMRLSDHLDAQLRVWLEALHHATNLMTRTVSQLVNASATFPWMVPGEAEGAGHRRQWCPHFDSSRLP